MRYQNDQLDNTTGHATPVDSWSGSGGQVRVKSGQVGYRNDQLDELNSMIITHEGVI